MNTLANMLHLGKAFQNTPEVIVKKNYNIRIINSNICVTVVVQNSQGFLYLFSCQELEEKIKTTPSIHEAGA